MNKQPDTLNDLAKQYSEGKIVYKEYKRRRTILLKNIAKGNDFPVGSNHNNPTTKPKK